MSVLRNCCEADPALVAAYGVTCKWTSEELPGPAMIVCPPESNFERNSGVCSAPSGLVFQANSLYVAGGIPRRVNVPPSIRLCSFVEPLGWPGTSAPFQELIRHPNIDGFGVTTVAIQIGKELWLGSGRGDRIAIFPLPQSPPSRQSVLAGLCHRVTLQRNQNVPRMTPAIMPPNPIRPRASPGQTTKTRRHKESLR